MFYGTLNLNKMKMTLSILGLCLVGLASFTAALARAENLVTPSLTSDAKIPGQMLPVNAIAIMGGQQIELEVATTPKQKMLGLMYREFLPPNRGMLFNFEPAQYASFWMKNVLIPLDLVFFRDNRIVAIAANVPPCNVNPCPTYGPETKIDGVIELPGGRAIELGLQPGDLIAIEYLNRP